MPHIFKSIINICVWFLFLKGCVAVVLTLYTVAKILVDGDKLSNRWEAACAVGAFDFILACVAAWIRQKVG
jgi:hypothetical protein